MILFPYEFSVVKSIVLHRCLHMNLRLKAWKLMQTNQKDQNGMNSILNIYNGRA